MFKKISFYLFVFYCFEIGLFLFVAPWWLPHVWENNYFFYLYPAVKAVFMNGFFRGAVSGLGLLNIVLGVAEIIRNEREKQFRETRVLEQQADGEKKEVPVSPDHKP